MFGVWGLGFEHLGLELGVWGFEVVVSGVDSGFRGQGFGGRFSVLGVRVSCIGGTGQLCCTALRLSTGSSYGVGGLRFGVSSFGLRRARALHICEPK